MGRKSREKRERNILKNSKEIKPEENKVDRVVFTKEAEKAGEILTQIIAWTIIVFFLILVWGNFFPEQFNGILDYLFPPEPKLNIFLRR